jgi:hypothetical protein
VEVEIVFPVAALAFVSWRLYRALALGSVPAVRTLKNVHAAGRDDHPIIYWMFTGLLGLIWLFLAASIVSMIAPGLLPRWLTP